MKKYILIYILFLLCIENVFSQGVNVVTTKYPGQTVYVGSLNETSSSTYQKLKIEVFGGLWYNKNLGICTFYISSREGILINKETRGGDSQRYDLKIYKTSTGYDFAIETKTQYTALWIQSWLLNGTANKITPMEPVNIIAYDSTGKTDVTNQYPINSIYSTTNAGNVGIGIENPTNKLEVAGTIRSKEVKVEATGWADFVFGEDYRLPSLSEVESHIKEKGTLPDIPSEQEVKESGVNLGEMQIKLLQKIEELTLYTIEQQKQLEEQSKQINTLQQQIENLKK